MSDLPKRGGVYRRLEEVGDAFVDYFHIIGLMIIGLVIGWATIAEVVKIFMHSGPSIKEILLLFIYLELGAMVGIYFKTKHLPVRFLLYIAITALTRVLAIDIKDMDNMRMLMLSAAILILSLSILVIRIGSHRFPGISRDH